MGSPAWPRKRPPASPVETGIVLISVQVQDIEDSGQQPEHRALFEFVLSWKVP